MLPVDPPATGSAAVFVSPAELLMDLLNREMISDICPAGAVVGPANDDQQNQGVVSVMDAGVNRRDAAELLLWNRSQLRCMASDLAGADQIARHVYALLYQRRRTVVRQTSTGDKWLIHWTRASAGPSGHYDSPETWEMLVFIELLVGLTPIT